MTKEVSVKAARESSQWEKKNKTLDINYSVMMSGLSSSTANPSQKDFLCRIKRLIGQLSEMIRVGNVVYERARGALSEIPWDEDLGLEASLRDNGGDKDNDDFAVMNSPNSSSPAVTLGDSNVLSQITTLLATENAILNVLEDLEDDIVAAQEECSSEKSKTLLPTARVMSEDFESNDALELMHDYKMSQEEILHNLNSLLRLEPRKQCIETIKKLTREICEKKTWNTKWTSRFYNAQNAVDRYSSRHGTIISSLEGGVVQ